MNLPEHTLLLAAYQLLSGNSSWMESSCLQKDVKARSHQGNKKAFFFDVCDLFCDISLLIVLLSFSLLLPLSLSMNRLLKRDADN